MTAAEASCWVSAGCKLNLYLHVNGRRRDGYHELQTHFQLLDYGDELRFETDDLEGIEVEWIAGDEPVDARPAQAEDDLLYRAAQALLGHVPESDQHQRCGARIILRKNVPVGGGLGGGSAAAARVLLVLNERWGLHLSLDQLCRIGVGLGADVPVFLRGRSATAHGIGDLVAPSEIPDLPVGYLVLIPRRSASTAALFGSPALERNTPKHDDARLRARWRSEGFNAFEPLALASDDELAELHAALVKQARFARLTGSGACLFAPVESPEAGRRIGEALQARHPILRRFVVAAPRVATNQDVSETGRRVAEK